MSDERNASNVTTNTNPDTTGAQGMASEPVISVRDLTVSFASEAGTVRAVRGMNFDLYPGKTLGIVGESGSGKSVTSMAIMGLLDKNASVKGSITYHGEELLSKSDLEMSEIRGKGIAMVFQDPLSALTPVFSIGDQIKEALVTHNPKMTEQQIHDRSIELMNLVGIPDPEGRLKSFPHEFSGGMRQRVMIAMGLICHPKLLIADEPTTALDVTIQAQILELMKELQKKTHMGIIFITHNLGVVAEICDKVSVMYAGKIVEQGPVDDIFYKPGHPYTVGLLRSMPRVDAESYERLIPIEGTPVDMLNPPEGCPFAPRCEHAMKICLQKMPPYVELGEGHRSACWLRVQDQLDKAGQEKPVQDQEVSGRE